MQKRLEDAFTCSISTRPKGAHPRFLLPIWCIFWVLLFIGVGGCSTSFESPTPSNEGEYLVHVVSGPGESIKQLSTWYTGSERNLKVVKAANPTLGTGSLKVGRRIFIPIAVVKRTDPPTTLSSNRAKQQAAAASAATSNTTGDGTSASAAELQGASKTATNRTINAESSEGSLERFEEELGAPPTAGSSAFEESDSENHPTSAGNKIEAQQPLAQSPQGAENQIGDFESRVDELLAKEQAELEQLRKELEP